MLHEYSTNTSSAQPPLLTNKRTFSSLEDGKENFNGFSSVNERLPGIASPTSPPRLPKDDAAPASDFAGEDMDDEGFNEIMTQYESQGADSPLSRQERRSTEREIAKTFGQGYIRLALSE